MLPRNHPDRIQIAFDDHRLVANAGLLLPPSVGHFGKLGSDSSNSQGFPNRQRALASCRNS